MLTNIMLEEGCPVCVLFHGLYQPLLGCPIRCPIIWFLGTVFCLLIILTDATHSSFCDKVKALWLLLRTKAAPLLTSFSISTFPNSTDPLRSIHLFFPILNFHPGVSSIRFHISRYGDSSIILSFLMGDFKYLSLTNTRV